MTLAIYGPAKSGAHGIYRSPTIIAEALQAIAAEPSTDRRIFRPWQAPSGNAIFGDLTGIARAGGYDSRTRGSSKKMAAAKVAPTARAQTKAFAAQITAAGKLTKTAKKKRREEVEQQVLGLLPDLPEAVEFAASVAQAVVRREAAFMAEHPALALEPDFAPLRQFDAQPVIQQMLKRWKPPVVRHPDDEFEVEALLLLG